MIIYLFLNSGLSLSVLSSNNRSSYCSEYQQHETNPIHDICSFAHYLGLNEWTNRQCHFKRPVEGHWLIGSLMTWWYGLTKQQHCDTINVHRFLQKGPIKQNEREIIDEDQFTILINTWRRNECLIDSVEHYLRCPAVAQIRIIWSDPIKHPPGRLVAIRRKLGGDRLVFDEYGDDKLTNRFKWNDDWRTEGIFQTDDDIKFSCDLITNTFKLWRAVPDHLIGFAPRIPLADYRVRGRQSPKRAFYEWDRAFTECQYELLFQTLGGFIHRKYYALYSQDGMNGEGTEWKQIKESVDGNVTAEDISLSLHYSFSSGNAPISVVVPESEMYIDDFLKCTGDKSVIMHTNSAEKRTNIFLDILTVLGFYDNDSDFNVIPSSSLFVDVMPISDQKCWAG